MIGSLMVVTLSESRILINSEKSVMCKIGSSPSSSNTSTIIMEVQGLFWFFNTTTNLDNIAVKKNYTFEKNIMKTCFFDHCFDLIGLQIKMQIPDYL